jgi:hypothetical protein
VASDARIFPVDTNFQQMARRPGGMPRDRAIERAEIEIEETKGEFDEWLGRELAELAAAVEAARLSQHDPEQLAELAHRGRQIRDVSATMRFGLLSFVADSLCDLLDSIGAEAELPMDSIACHLDALSLSARPDYRELRPDEVPDLTRGLRRVVKHAGA